jgi:hypothetical protein
MPILMVDDITDVEAYTVLRELLGLARVQYNLRELCKVVRIPHLTADIRTATTYSGSEKVPELVEADIKSHTYSKASFDLWKNVVHLAVSLEAKLKSDIDVMGLQISDAAKELARMENSQIATIIEAGATSGTGYVWDDKSNGISDHDPVFDILTAEDTIFGYGYDPNKLAMNHTQYIHLVTNTHITSLLERGTIVKTGILPAVAGYPLLIDNGITADHVYLVAKGAPASILGEGPEVAVKYGDDDPRFFTGYAVAKFLEPKVTVATGVVDIACTS